MKPTACAMLLCFAAPFNVLAQTGAPPHMAPPSEVRISPELAETMLIHKVDPKGKCTGMPASITGTVVIAIQIGVHGEVLHPTIVSGPRMLRQAALDAVRQYKYKPYELNGKHGKADTTVSVHFEHFPCG